MFGRYDVDAMGERGAGQIGIEQGNHAADAGDAKPYGDVFGTIGHQQADDFAFCETLRRAPIGHIGLIVRRALDRSSIRGRIAEPACHRICAASSSITVDKMRSRLRGWAQSVPARATRPSRRKRWYRPGVFLSSIKR